MDLPKIVMVDSCNVIVYLERKKEVLKGLIEPCEDPYLQVSSVNYEHSRA